MRDFELENISEEDAEEMLDALIDSFKDELIADESRTAIINPLRLKQIEFSYKALKLCAKGSDVAVTYSLHKPYKSMGSVTVEGTELEFISSKWFSRAAEFASNMEVYPLEKNKVRLTLTFHGLTTPIEEVPQ